MKTKVKNTATYTLIILMMFAFAGFNWNKGKSRAQSHQMALDILSEEKVEFINLDSKIIGDKIIVLDSDGNVVLSKSQTEVENKNLSTQESLILFEADFLFENQGDNIYIQN